MTTLLMNANPVITTTPSGGTCLLLENSSPVVLESLPLLCTIPTFAFMGDDTPGSPSCMPLSFCDDASSRSAPAMFVSRGSSSSSLVPIPISSTALSVGNNKCTPSSSSSRSHKIIDKKKDVTTTMSGSAHCPTLPSSTTAPPRNQSVLSSNRSSSFSWSPREDRGLRATALELRTTPHSVSPRSSTLSLPDSRHARPSSQSVLLQSGPMVHHNGGNVSCGKRGRSRSRGRGGGSPRRATTRTDTPAPPFAAAASAERLSQNIRGLVAELRNQARHPTATSVPLSPPLGSTTTAHNTTTTDSAMPTQGPPSLSPFENVVSLPWGDKRANGGEVGNVRGSSFSVVPVCSRHFVPVSGPSIEYVAACTTLHEVARFHQAHEERRRAGRRDPLHPPAHFSSSGAANPTTTLLPTPPSTAPSSPPHRAARGSGRSSSSFSSSSSSSPQEALATATTIISRPSPSLPFLRSQQQQELHLLANRFILIDLMNLKQQIRRSWRRTDAFLRARNVHHTPQQQGGGPRQRETTPVAATTTTLISLVQDETMLTTQKREQQLWLDAVRGHLSTQFLWDVSNPLANYRRMLIQPVAELQDLYRYRRAERLEQLKMVHGGGSTRLFHTTLPK